MSKYASFGFQGHHHSEETKKHMSITKKGTPPPNKGKPCSEIQKEKIRQTLRRGTITKCAVCSKDIYSSPSRLKKYCSRECLFKDWVGEKNPTWAGGKSRYYRMGYYSREYKEWRGLVFKRDGYSCVQCGAKGYITAHHIKSFAYFPELRYELSNGLTLCVDCHKKTDNYMGRATKCKMQHAN